MKKISVLYKLLACVLLITSILTSCANRDLSEDGWQQQWDKLVVKRSLDVVCIKSEMIDIINDDYYDDDIADKRIYDKDVKPILKVLSSVGSEFYKVDDPDPMQIKGPFIRLKVIHDIDFNAKVNDGYAYIVGIDSFNFNPDESESGYVYAIRVYVSEDHVYVRTANEIYASVSKPDYKALLSLLEDK